MAAIPPVSIGLPVYNGERYLPQTLRDLLGQSFGDFELVVSDNASTDATEAIVREAAEADPRVRYSRNEANLGALANTNRVFDLSRGRLFALAGHDDRHAPDFLMRLVDALREDPGAVLAFGDATLIDHAGRLLPPGGRPGTYLAPAGLAVAFDDFRRARESDDPVVRFRETIRATDVNLPIHGLFRREVLEQVGPHEFLGSDRLVVAATGLYGRFRYVDEPLFAYRIHPGSTVHLTRAEWTHRETGCSQRPAHSFRDGVKTLGRYLQAVREAELPARLRPGAFAACVGTVVSGRVLSRLLLPDEHSYWGVTRWPWQRQVLRKGLVAYSGPPETPPEWQWLERATASGSTGGDSAPHAEPDLIPQPARH